MTFVDKTFNSIFTATASNSRNRTGAAPIPIVLHTESTLRVLDDREDSQRTKAASASWHYILAVNLSTTFQLDLGDLTYSTTSNSATKTYTEGSIGSSGSAPSSLALNFYTGETTLLGAGTVLSLDTDTAWGGFHDPKDNDAGNVSQTALPFGLWTLAPMLCGGQWAFVEKDKFVGAAGRRFTCNGSGVSGVSWVSRVGATQAECAVECTADGGLQVPVSGSAGEEVTLMVAQLQPPSPLQDATNLMSTDPVRGTDTGTGTGTERPMDKPLPVLQWQRVQCTIRGPLETAILGCDSSSGFCHCEST